MKNKFAKGLLAVGAAVALTFGMSIPAQASYGTSVSVSGGVGQVPIVLDNGQWRYLMPGQAQSNSVRQILVPDGSCIVSKGRGTWCLPSDGRSSVSFKYVNLGLGNYTVYRIYI